VGAPLGSRAASAGAAPDPAVVVSDGPGVASGAAAAGCGAAGAAER
jgi:hypothetical protein